MSFIVSFGRYGGFYFRRSFTVRLCLGWMALTFIPRDIDDVLRDALNAGRRESRAEREGWKRLALYWRNEWRLYTKTYVGQEYVAEYIRLGSISRRHQRNAESGQQAGE